MANRIARKLKIQNALVREMLAEFLGTFILMVSIICQRLIMCARVSVIYTLIVKRYHNILER